MANPRLRILLVDEDDSRRMNIEKNLAGLGYSRVAPLASLRELLIVMDNALLPFDLLIIHEAVLGYAGRVLEQSVRECPVIKHLLVYQGNYLHVLSSVESSPSALSFSLPCPPDQASIKHVMSVVDKAELQRVYSRKHFSAGLNEKS